MDSNNRNSCCFASPFHFMFQIGFGKWEYPLIRCQGIIHLKVIPHLFTEKLRHYNDPVTFRCLWRSNNVLLFHPVVRFIDPHRLFLKIKICRCEGKQLCFCQYKTKKNMFFLQKAPPVFPGDAPANNYSSFFSFTSMTLLLSPTKKISSIFQMISILPPP